MRIWIIFITLFFSLSLLSCGGGSTNSSTVIDNKPQEDAYAKVKAYIQKDINATAPTVNDYSALGATGVNEENLDTVNATLLKYIAVEYIATQENVQELVSAIVELSPITIVGDSEVMQRQSITLSLTTTKESNLSKIEWLDANATLLGNATTLTYPAMEAVGSEYVVVRVIFEDSSVALAFKSVTTTPYQNTLTIISGTPITSLYQDDSYSFTPTIVNEDDDPLTFNATNLPNWLSVDTKSGKLYGTPTNSDVGIARDINLSVDDGKDVVTLPLFDITVINVNDAPTLSGTPPAIAYEDSNYSFAPIAIDIDANTTLLFSSQAFPAWLHLDPQTGVISGVPNYSDVGIKSALRLIISDGIATDTIEFRLEILSVNDAPKIDTVGSVVNATEDSNFTLDINASDEEGDSITYMARDLPTWASIDSQTGLISGTPTNDHVGLSSTIWVFAQDSHGDESNISFQINVINTNDAPVFKVTKLADATEDELYQYQVDVEDLDPDDRLEFRASNLPSWCDIKPANGEIVGIPTNDDVGIVRDINITVSDGNVTVSKLLDLEVINTNDAPTILGKPTRDFVPATVDFKFRPVAQDVDLNATLSFSLSNHPEWMSIDTQTGALLGQPDVEDIGIYTGIVVTVTDGYESVDLDEFNISVTPIAPPLKTGQKVIYEANDDGEYESGAVRSFTRFDDIVTSTSTGKMWQDDAAAKSVTKPWLDETNYVGRRFEDSSDPSTAASYCANLSLGGYSNWRLPTAKELMTLTDKSKTDNSIDDIFQNVSGGIYWSSTTLKYSPSKAWAVKFDFGVDRWEEKNELRYVRCIRDKE